MNWAFDLVSRRAYLDDVYWEPCRSLEPRVPEVSRLANECDTQVGQIASLFP